MRQFQQLHFCLSGEGLCWMCFQLVKSVAIILNIISACSFPGYYCLLCISHWFLDGTCCSLKLLFVIWFRRTQFIWCSCCCVRHIHIYPCRSLYSTHANHQFCDLMKKKKSCNLSHFILNEAKLIELKVKEKEQ